MVAPEPKTEPAQRLPVTEGLVRPWPFCNSEATYPRASFRLRLCIQNAPATATQAVNSDSHLLSLPPPLNHQNPHPDGPVLPPPSCSSPLRKPPSSGSVWTGRMRGSPLSLPRPPGKSRQYLHLRCCHGDHRDAASAASA